MQQLNTHNFLLYNNKTIGENLFILIKQILLSTFFIQLIHFEINHFGPSQCLTYQIVKYNYILQYRYSSLSALFKGKKIIINDTMKYIKTRRVRQYIQQSSFFFSSLQQFAQYFFDVFEAFGVAFFQVFEQMFLLFLFFDWLCTLTLRYTQ